MAPKILHCDLCLQGKPRLCVDVITVSIDDHDYPVQVCERHRAVLKNMFLGAIPASAFGKATVQRPAKKVSISSRGKVTAPARPAAKKKSTPSKIVKKSATKKTAPKKATKTKSVVKVAAKKVAPARKAPARKAPARKR